MGTFLRCVRSWAWMRALLAVALAIVAPAGSARAVHDTMVFELDGDSVVSSADDFDTILSGPGGSFDSLFVDDSAEPDASVHKDSNKDGDPIGALECRTKANVTNKNDIRFGYAASYVAGPDDHVHVFFGLNRDSNLGDSNVGFWFFQQEVACDPGTGLFGGYKTDGDVLIVGDFAGGGAVTVALYRWTDPTPGAPESGDESLVAAFSGIDCQDADPHAVSPLACGTANGDTITVPWEGSPLAERKFFEGGIDLDGVFEQLGTQDVCFRSFMAETRASESINSDLEDFITGELKTCGSISVEKVTSPSGSGQLFDFVTAGGPAAVSDAFQLRDGDPTHVTASLPAGTYSVTESLPSGWDLAGVECQGGPFGGGAPYVNGAPFALAPGDQVVCTFTNQQPVTCQKSSVQAVLDPITGSFPGNSGFDTTVFAGSGALQAAVDGAADGNGDGYVMVGMFNDASGLPGGTSVEGVVIDRVYDDPFALIGCSVTLQDPEPLDGVPVATIAAGASSPGTASIFVMDLHVENGDVAGWRVEGDGRVLRNVRAADNAGAGIEIVGDGNTVMNSPGIDANATGISAVGDGNVILDNREITENVGDGIRVVGSGNVVDGNEVGERNRGNGGNGIFVLGSGNGTPDPVEILDNVVVESGLAGIAIQGAGHELHGNESGGVAGGSGDNLGCEYDVAVGNFDARENRANGQIVPPNSNGQPFPAGCVGTPPPAGQGAAPFSGMIATALAAEGGAEAGTMGATLTVDLVTEPEDDPWSFELLVAGGPAPGIGEVFELADASPSHSTIGLLPGTYTVTQTVPPGWDLVGAACAGGTFGLGAPYASGGDIVLAEGDHVVCAFLDHRRLVVNAPGTELCGNDILDVGEACDDGNREGGDGCSPTCGVERCFACAGEPSVCTCQVGVPCGSLCGAIVRCELSAAGVCGCTDLP